MRVMRRHNELGVYKERTSRQLVLYLHILLCSHTEEMGYAVTIRVPVGETLGGHGARRAWLIIVARHDGSAQFRCSLRS